MVLFFKGFLNKLPLSPESRDKYKKSIDSMIEYFKDKCNVSKLFSTAENNYDAVVNEIKLLLSKFKVCTK